MCCPLTKSRDEPLALRAGSNTQPSSAPPRRPPQTPPSTSPCGWHARSAGPCPTVSATPSMASRNTPRCPKRKAGSRSTGRGTPIPRSWTPPTRRTRRCASTCGAPPVRLGLAHTLPDPSPPADARVDTPPAAGTGVPCVLPPSPRDLPGGPAGWAGGCEGGGWWLCKRARRPRCSRARLWGKRQQTSTGCAQGCTRRERQPSAALLIIPWAGHGGSPSDGTTRVHGARGAHTGERQPQSRQRYAGTWTGTPAWRNTRCRASCKRFSRVRRSVKQGGMTVASPSRAYMTMAPDISCGPNSAQFSPCYGCSHTTCYLQGRVPGQRYSKTSSGHGIHPHARGEIQNILLEESRASMTFPWSENHSGHCYECRLYPVSNRTSRNVHMRQRPQCKGEAIEDRPKPV